MPSNSSQPFTEEELRTISHDLKNDLASILALMEMIKFSMPPEQQAKQQKNLDRLKDRIFAATEKIDTTFKKLRESL